MPGAEKEVTYIDNYHVVNLYTLLLQQDMC